LTENQPVTRLGRIIQQLSSFADLHANELSGVADDIDSADIADRLRTIRDIQRDEARMLAQELLDLQDDLVSAAPSGAVPVAPGDDPAANSPGRAKWLAEQAAEAERLPEPLSRRELFEKVANPEGENEEDLSS
jgi:hypothetical protein